MRRLRHDEIHRPAPTALAGMPRHPVVLVLENIRSAHNVGSILRTADGFRLSEVICCGYTPPADHRSVFKTSLGAEETVPWRHVARSVDVILDLKDRDYTIAALELTDTPAVVSDLQIAHFPLALIAGNEVEGVSDEALALCHIALEIPQFGAKQSLNVAVALGMAAHDLVRHYRHLRGEPLFLPGDPRFEPTSPPTP